jgi:hypothetical protein
MTDNNIQEAEVGSGTKISDTKQSEKRAQLTLKAIQLRLKQEKERAALQQQKKSLRVKEDIEESFSPSQIAALKAEYSKINGIDPDSDTYKKLIAMLDKLDLKSLKSLADANVKFVSKLAQNRVLRKSMKKEDVRLDENEDLANARKMYHKHFVAAMKAMPSSIVQKRHQDEMEKYKKIMGNSFIDQVAPSKFAKFDKKIKEEVEQIDEQHSVLYKMKKTDPKIAVAHYKSKDDADKFLASVKEKGGNGVVRVGKIGLDLTSTNKKINELSNEKLADYKKKAGESASAADKAGDTKTGNKRFSGIMKATKKQFANDTKEELSPKQKALDKNKNGKIDGSDLAKLRGEELSPAQKAIDKNKNGKIDGSDLAHLRSKKKQPQGADFAAQRRKERLASNGRMDEAKSDYEVYHKDYSSAVQTAIKQAEKRGFEVDMDDWHDKVATGPKKPSSGKTNSFSVKLKKDGKESKKALHLQVYNMDNHKYELNMYIESLEEGTQRVDSLVTDALKIMKGSELKDAVQALKTVIGDREYNDRRGHYNFYVKQLVDMYGKRDVKEAASPAQQAAIAIAMKKAGKKPKDMEESDAYDKDVKPSDKPHDKDAAAKRAKLAALAARKKMAEGLMDKIKAIKRGAEAKSKADDHFDKAGDPKNANASKDLKKAVRYHNLLNKEENGIQANAVTKHVTKGEITKSGVAKWLAEPNKKVKQEEAVPEFKSGGPELAKKFNKSFKSLGVNAKVKIKTVGNVSVNEEEITEAKKKSWKDMRKKTKNEEAPSKATIQKGDQLTGKREPIEINPELKDTAK